jgi:purine-nucleoside phosphorylase
MTPHIEAKKGDYAETVLMPGDPLRAKWIAETFFDNPVQVNGVRNCLGFTGTYNNKKISVQAGGMGMPSNAIYITEL